MMWHEMVAMVMVVMMPLVFIADEMLAGCVATACKAGDGGVSSSECQAGGE